MNIFKRIFRFFSEKRKVHSVFYDYIEPVYSRLEIERIRHEPSVIIEQRGKYCFGNKLLNDQIINPFDCRLKTWKTEEQELMEKLMVKIKDLKLELGEEA